MEVSSFEMLSILLVYPVVLAAVQTLKIDTQLGTSVEDCFDRISIGEQLSNNAIYRNLSELTTRECEDICKHDKQCQTYDYGVGAKGNATCDLSRLDEKQLKANLFRHPDFDVYVRRVQCEQTPPLPIQPSLYDASEGSSSGEGSSQDQGPSHRPVHRPEAEDPRRPLSDQQLTDLRPYEANPPTKPNKPLSSDSSQGLRPEDSPSYGAFMPQNIPYKPEYGFYSQPGNYRPPFYRPQNRPYPSQYGFHQPPNDIGNYRPDKPDYIHSSDILYFQEQIRPPYPNSYRPDPDPYYNPQPMNEVTEFYGQRPQEFYGPERPQYQYTNQHIKRPEIPDRPGYGYEPQQHPIKPQLDEPLGLPKLPYKPNRPSYLRPSEHHVQYESGYVENHQGSSESNQHSAPSRPLYDSYEHNGGGLTGYGYGSDHYSNQNVQKPHVFQSQFGYGTITEIDNDNNGHRPQGPSYNEPPKPNDQISVHNQYMFESNIGSTQKPQDSNQNYGIQHSGTKKPSPKPLNGYHILPSTQSDTDHYGNQPSYGTNNPKPHYESQHLYGNQPSFTNDHSLYGSNRPLPDRPFYDSNRPDPTYNKPFLGDGNQQSEAGGYSNHVEDNNDTGNHKRNQTTSNHASSNHLDHVKPVYEFDRDRPSGVPNYISRPNGEVITSRPVVVGDYGGRPHGREPGVLGHSYIACFRRVLAGSRALRSHVRRVVGCERLEDCRRECAEERRFHCESFNYRLDPSFRGKGLCELMTKPIEAFNIRQDFVEDKNYDFYELDRNSLEPHCPETLKGPGLLHSGYLSSRSSSSVPFGNNWMTRGDAFEDRGVSRNRGYNRYDDDRERHPGRRRYPVEPYVPYQIGVGRNDEREHWGQYGGVYGGQESYYKNRNEYHKSINHWRLNDIQPSGVKPYGHHGSFNYHDLGKNIWDRYGGSWNRGRWDNAGTTGLDYGESNYYNPPMPPRPHSTDPAESRDEPEPIVKECTSRRRPGMSLSSGSIRRALLARNVVECESACFNEIEFRCVSYSFRYSNSRGTDNCFLSERPYRGLDLATDSGSDVYAMQDHGCTAVSHKPWVESECFWHVRSGAAVSGEVAKAAITAAGLGACEAECIRAQGFFCRGFSFRFDSPVIGDDLENCILTSSPPTSLDNGRGLRPTVGHELYSRGNYGRGCEPALYDDADQHHDEYECYLQYDNAAKLLHTAVKGQATTKDEQACGKACTDAPFRCLSFSFNNNALPDKENCLLSEIRLFDLQRGVDYEHSADDWLFAFDLFNSQCHRKVVMNGGYEEPVSGTLHPIAPRPEDSYRGPEPAGSPGYLPSGPAGPAYIPGSGPGYGPYPDNQIYKPSYPIGRPEYQPEIPKPYPAYLPATPPKGPTYLPQHDPGFTSPNGPYRPGIPRPVYDQTGPYIPGYLPNVSHRPSGAGYPEPIPSEPRPHPQPGYGSGGGKPIRPIGPGDRGEPIAVSWMHYTVSGFPCRQGTTCAQNQISGHWACEPEGGEIGSWDYCCAPSHRCGYSEGFHKPWCYVGAEKDQWRPCSEKYYPYHQHNMPHPSQGHRGDGHHHRPNPWQGGHLPDRHPNPYLPEDDRKYWDDLYKNGPKAYYDQYGNPLPGYTRVPIAERPHIRYHHNYPQPGGGPWVPVQQDFDPQQPGLGTARYWPVAYLHKSPPPNMTYFQYNESHKTTTEKYIPTPLSLPNNRSQPFYSEDNSTSTIKHRDEKTRNMSEVDKDLLSLTLDLAGLNFTNASARDGAVDIISEILNQEDDKSKENDTQVEMIKPVTTEKAEKLKGISGKIDDFSGSIEILDIEDAKKGEKKGDYKTLEAEERQIEAIGRLLASRRDGKLVIEKRSQKELDTKNIALDRELLNFDFGNKFPASERRGIIQKVTKEEIDRERSLDKSLEVSETTFVRPPRVLSTTTTDRPEVRKTVFNGKVFYDATLREQKELANTATTTRRPKNLRPLEERAPTVFSNSNYSFGRKNNIRARNANPVRKVRRVYRRRYNPGEVRKRLLEKERNKQDSNGENEKA